MERGGAISGVVTPLEALRRVLVDPARPAHARTIERTAVTVAAAHLARLAILLKQQLGDLTGEIRRLGQFLPFHDFCHV